MIESLQAENYKSFRKINFDISNINILLGANSCGKSSITNLLLMLSQTADNYNSYGSLLRLNGGKSSLGEPINIFPDKCIDNEIKIGWGLTDDFIEKGLKQLRLVDVVDELDSYCRFIAYTARRKNNNVDMDIYRKAMEYLAVVYNSAMFESDSLLKDGIVDSFKVGLNNALKTTFKFHNSEDFDKYKFEKIKTSRLNDLIDVFTIPESVRKVKYIEYSILYNSARQECELKRLSIFNSSKKLVIGVVVSKSKKIELLSDIYCKYSLERSRLDIVRDIDLNNFTLLSDDFSVKCKNPFSKYIRSYIGGVLRFFSKSIAGSNLNHVTPLRAFPQRYYLLEKSAQHNVLNSNDGSQLAEILKNNPIVLDRVNELFKDFGIKISTAKTNDIIHRITVKQNNVTVELTDVGFGISQVLPILVQVLLCPPHSLTIIEQPEIHLHPKMQAWLTNVLVSISVKEDKKLIIETHSDIIIKRLQILFLDPSVEFSKNNINIYHLDRKDDGMTDISKVNFTAVGDISWPDGFMDLEIDDAIKFQRLKVEKIKHLKEVDDV
ncbi:AAA family ATPase [Rheinheimera gaetbuli]